MKEVYCCKEMEKGSAYPLSPGLTFFCNEEKNAEAGEL